MYNYVTDQNIDDVDLPAANDKAGWSQYLPQTVFAQSLYQSALDILAAKAAVEWVLQQIEKGGGEAE